MENTNKSAGTAVKVANALKVISIVGVVFCIVGAICGFALNGFINEYYSDPNNVAAAKASIEADMGIFRIIPFDTFKDSGNYGVFFGVQLLCSALVCVAYVYVFASIKKILENVRDTGKAFLQEEAKKYKSTYIVITILLICFSGISIGLIAGLLLCGLYNVTVASQQA